MIPSSVCREQGTLALLVISFSGLISTDNVINEVYEIAEPVCLCSISRHTKNSATFDISNARLLKIRKPLIHFKSDHNQNTDL